MESCLLFQVRHTTDFNINFIESFNEKEDFETLIRPLISKSQGITVESLSQRAGISLIIAKLKLELALK